MIEENDYTQQKNGICNGARLPPENKILFLIEPSSRIINEIKRVINHVVVLIFFGGKKEVHSGGFAVVGFLGSEGIMIEALLLNFQCKGKRLLSGSLLVQRRQRLTLESAEDRFDTTLLLVTPTKNTKKI